MSYFISRAGVIGKKLGMTNLFIDNKFIPVTVINIPKNFIFSIKSMPFFDIVKLGIIHKKNINKPQIKECEKNNIEPCSFMKEFKVNKNEITKDDILNSKWVYNLNFVDITGISSGKGFAGCMKKYNFKGNNASHGASLSHRGLGSTGIRDKMWKGKKMPGQMGNNKVTKQNLKTMDFDSELNCICVSGSIPGKPNSLVIIRKAIKKG